MKLSRLCTYATAGIIVGLIAENTIMKYKDKAECKAGELKKKAEKLAGKKS